MASITDPVAILVLMNKESNNSRQYRNQAIEFSSFGGAIFRSALKPKRILKEIIDIKPAFHLHEKNAY